MVTLFPDPVVYTTGCLLALLTSTCAIPLMTQIYHDNYPTDQRGRLYSSAFMVRIASAMVFAWIGGQILSSGLIPASASSSSSFASDRWRWMTALFALAYWAAAAAVRRIPTRALDSSAAIHPLQGLRFVREDPVFRNALLAWMLMGFANLAMLPIRVEYLGNPRFGLGLSASQIAWLTLVIPNAARWIMSPVWGRLFDRMNFFRLRITLNAGFAVGIATFFMSETPVGLVIGAIFYGISTAGGDVAWGLWVTKVAPPAHVTDYMAVHTFSTGIRGVLAPLCAFHAVQTLSPATMGWIAAAMIVAACGLLIPEIRGADLRRRESV
jgi:MFS family permease